MQKHVKTYLKHFDYCEQDVILCENCQQKAVDIHHLLFRSHGGKDEINNLMALCRKCHDEAHNSKSYNEKLKQIHENFISKY